MIEYSDKLEIATDRHINNLERTTMLQQVAGLVIAVICLLLCEVAINKLSDYAKKSLNYYNQVRLACICNGPEFAWLFTFMVMWPIVTTAVALLDYPFAPCAPISFVTSLVFSITLINLTCLIRAAIYTIHHIKKEEGK